MKKRRGKIINNRKAQGSIATHYMVAYIMIDIFLIAGGFITSTSPYQSTMDDFVDINLDNQTIIHNDTLTMQQMGVSTEVNQTRSGIVFGIFDAGAFALSGISLVVRGTFAPIAVLLSINAPFIVVLIAGVLPSIVFVVSILAFVRGKDF